MPPKPRAWQQKWTARFLRTENAEEGAIYFSSFGLSVVRGKQYTSRRPSSRIPVVGRPLVQAMSTSIELTGWTR